MTFKEFDRWCNKRACDGYWGVINAITCCSIVEEILKLPFWKREKIWKNKYETDVVNQIVNPVNEMIEKRLGIKVE